MSAPTSTLSRLESTDSSLRSSMVVSQGGDPATTVNGGDLESVRSGSQPTMVVIKLFTNSGSTHRISIFYSGEKTLDLIANKVRQIWPQHSKYTLGYFDDDNEFISIASEGEFDECLRFFGQQDTIKLQIVFPESDLAGSRFSSSQTQAGYAIRQGGAGSEIDPQALSRMSSMPYARSQGASPDPLNRKSSPDPYASNPVMRALANGTMRSPMYFVSDKPDVYRARSEVVTATFMHDVGTRPGAGGNNGNVEHAIPPGSENPALATSNSNNSGNNSNYVQYSSSQPARSGGRSSLSIVRAQTVAAGYRNGQVVEDVADEQLDSSPGMEPMSVGPSMTSGGGAMQQGRASGRISRDTRLSRRNNRAENPFWKTKLCSYFARGECKKTEEECSFSHILPDSGGNVGVLPNALSPLSQTSVSSVVSSPSAQSPAGPMSSGGAIGGVAGLPPRHVRQGSGGSLGPGLAVGVNVSNNSGSSAVASSGNNGGSGAGGSVGSGASIPNSSSASSSGGLGSSSSQLQKVPVLDDRSIVSSMRHHANSDSSVFMGISSAGVNEGRAMNHASGSHLRSQSQTLGSSLDLSVGNDNFVDVNPQQQQHQLQHQQQQLQIQQKQAHHHWRERDENNSMLGARSNYPVSQNRQASHPQQQQQIHSHMQPHTSVSQQTYPHANQYNSRGRDGANANNSLSASVTGGSGRLAPGIHPSLLNPFWKTKVCTYFLNGDCKKSDDQCPFKHVIPSQLSGNSNVSGGGGGVHLNQSAQSHAYLPDYDSGAFRSGGGGGGNSGNDGYGGRASTRHHDGAGIQRDASPSQSQSYGSHYASHLGQGNNNRSGGGSGGGSGKTGNEPAGIMHSGGGGQDGLIHSGMSHASSLQSYSHVTQQEQQSGVGMAGYGQSYGASSGAAHGSSSNYHSSSRNVSSGAGRGVSPQKSMSAHHGQPHGHHHPQSQQGQSQRQQQLQQGAHHHQGGNYYSGLVTNASGAINYGGTQTPPPQQMGAHQQLAMPAQQPQLQQQQQPAPQASSIYSQDPRNYSNPSSLQRSPQSVETSVGGPLFSSAGASMGPSAIGAMQQQQQQQLVGSSSIGAGGMGGGNRIGQQLISGTTGSGMSFSMASNSVLQSSTLVGDESRGDPFSASRVRMFSGTASNMNNGGGLATLYSFDNSLSSFASSPGGSGNSVSNSAHGGNNGGVVSVNAESSLEGTQGMASYYGSNSAFAKVGSQSSQSAFGSMSVALEGLKLSSGPMVATMASLSAGGNEGKIDTSQGSGSSTGTSSGNSNNNNSSSSNNNSNAGN